MTSGPPRSLRPASKRVLQVGQRVSVFFLQASAPPSAAYAGQFGRSLRAHCAWSRPWASLSTFPRQACRELGRPSRGVPEHFVPSARRPGSPPSRRRRLARTPRVIRRVWVGGPQGPQPAFPPPPHALVFGSPEARLCNLLLLFGLGVQTWVTPRVIERFRKMLWPILKQSPIISFRRLFVPVQCQIP